ncbi:hypothetical protein [Lysinibacillus piscis]|uniref:Uncharacterized protein n=1 Tax=Lysinibacillus piscis TaxID=2518931 RepID=A0ABQ5NFU3_9BACI|nr:hypothetical protein [Lysinibacillus sp. KH24]GLC87128.1 hypothetical protein LYSBPC_02550 [Lysinibacillus sp. KH24]
MSKLSIFLYSISIVVIVIIFCLINYFTAPLLVGKSNNISNGNPGLFPLVFLAPFLIIFMIGTFKVAYMAAKSTLQTRPFKIVMILSLLISGSIYFFTFKEARELRLLIFKHNNSVTEIHEITLLNIYSNSIFF